jgi:hypothetical protein
MTARYDNVRAQTKLLLETLGHTNVVYGGFDKNGKVQVTFTHSVCGEEQVWQASNITKRLKIDPNTAPCSKCGGKRRAMIATLASAKSRSEES